MRVWRMPALHRRAARVIEDVRRKGAASRRGPNRAADRRLSVAHGSAAEQKLFTSATLRNSKALAKELASGDRARSCPARRRDPQAPSDTDLRESASCRRVVDTWSDSVQLKTRSHRNHQMLMWRCWWRRGARWTVVATAHCVSTCSDLSRKLRAPVLRAGWKAVLRLHRARR